MPGCPLVPMRNSEFGLQCHLHVASNTPIWASPSRTDLSRPKFFVSKACGLARTNTLGRDSSKGRSHLKWFAILPFANFMKEMLLADLEIGGASLSRLAVELV
jgi:hypothetical protein